MRASAGYRLEAARNLLVRAFVESTQEALRLVERGAASSAAQAVAYG
jgi:xanthine dehydrogenase iron-sulfur cluster and FAD-binding subunit A